MKSVAQPGMVACASNRLPSRHVPEAKVHSGHPHRSLFYHCKNKKILKSSIRTALVVGVTLAFINHLDAIMALRVAPAELGQILVTFLVPFSVATYSAARHSQHLERMEASRSQVSVANPDAHDPSAD